VASFLNDTWALCSNIYGKARDFLPFVESEAVDLAEHYGSGKLYLILRTAI
jgi:hypothetical protein